MSLKALARVSEDGVRFRSHLDGSSHLLTPELAVEIQLALGADIIMILDECVEYPSSYETASRAVKLTGRWARRAKEYYLDARNAGAGIRASFDSSASTLDPRIPNTGSRPPALFGIVQGGIQEELRRESAEEMVKIGFEGYAVGGLSVGEPKEETYRMAEFTAGLLPVDRPRYLMGVGTPADLVECVARGIDLFDCVLPTRNARNGCAFTSEGKVIVKNARYARDRSPLDASCQCSVCRRYSRGYIRHLFMAGEMLAGILTTRHNLHFYIDSMRKIRQAIVSGEFDRLLARVRAGG
jgi:queuine tRNA-ribosyltransferase